MERAFNPVSSANSRSTQTSLCKEEAFFGRVVRYFQGIFYLSSIVSTTSGLNQYLLSCKETVELKDGKRSAALSGLFFQRCYDLERGLSEITSPYLFYFGASLYLSKAACVMKHFMEKQVISIASGFSWDEKSLKPLLCVFDQLEIYLDRFLELANPLLNSAYLVGSIALIALGFPLSGWIGIACVFLICLKKERLLPYEIEVLLEPFALLSSFYAMISLPANFLIKGAEALTLSSWTIDYFLARDYLSNKLPGEFVVDQTKSLQSFFQEGGSQEKLFKRMKSSFFLELNLSSIHASQPGEVLSSELQKELESTSLKILYQQLEERSSSLSKKEGWNAIKEAVLHRQVTGISPPHFKRFQNYLKQFLFVLSKEKEDREFLLKGEELAQIGNQCEMGWIAKARLLLKPQEKKIEFAVHRKLAEFRSALFTEEVKTLIQKIPGLSPFVGGENNAQFLDQMHKSFWHRWRTSQGDDLIHLSGRGAITTILQRPQNEYSIWSERLLFFCHTGMIALSDSFKSLVELGGGLNLRYSSSEVERVIFEAIKPDEEALKRGEVLREIQWDPTLVSWLADFSRRFEKDFDFTNSDGTYNEKWIASIPVERSQPLHYLTKEGVRLLLWDLGLLQSRKAFFLNP